MAREKGNGAERPANRRYGMRTTFIVFLLVVVIVTLIQTQTDHASVMSQVGEDAIGVAGAEESWFITYDEILSVELLEEFEIGEMVEGTENYSAYNGTFRNEEYGEYLLLSYKNTQAWISIQYEGGVLVFNCSSVKQTKQTFEDLTEQMAEAGK